MITTTILGFFSGWQVKIIIVLTLVFGAYVWHKAEVKIAVNEAVTAIEAQTTKERFKLLDRANEESFKLKEQIAKIEQEKERELQIADTKYKSLVTWVRNLPSTTSGSDSAGSTRDAKDRSEEVIGELRRSNAEALAGYAYQAEELKINLVACYRDYDAVKSARDKFVKENTLNTK